MTHALRQLVLPLLVVAQLALPGCASASRAPLHAPTPTLTAPVQGGLAPAYGAAPRATLGGNDLQQTCMQMGMGDLGPGFLVLVGIGVLTIPVWAPIYMLASAFKSRALR